MDGADEPKLERLFPDATEQEITDLREALHKYVRLMARIYRRMEAAGSLPLRLTRKSDNTYDGRDKGRAD